MSKQIQLSIDEKYLDLVPRPSKHERRALKESIMINGQREPIIINEKGIILDGHTRHEICQELGRDTKFSMRNFESKADEMNYVITTNLIRRQLSPFQKIELAFDLFKMIKEKNKRLTTKDLKNNKRRDSYREFAKSLGMGHNFVGQSIWLINNVDEKTKKMLRQSKTTVGKEYRISRLNLPKERHHVNKGKTYIHENAKLMCPNCKHEMKKRDLIRL